MKTFISYSILSFYFFIYLTPQYITNVFISFDRVYPQMLAISILNLITFIYVFKLVNFREYFNALKYKRHFLSYFLLIIFASISLLVADNFNEGVVSLVKIINLFIAFFFITIISSKGQVNFIKYFIIATIISLAVESFLINLRVFDGVFVNGAFLGRNNLYSGYGANINISSFSVLIKSIVVIYLIFNYKKGLVKYFSYFLVYTSMLAVFLLMSRAAMISLLLVLASILLLCLIANKKKYFIAYCSLLGIFLLTIFSYNLFNEKNAYNILEERFSNITNPIADQSVNERLNFYTTALTSIWENPILGIGIGNWRIKSIDLSKEIISSYRVPYFVHNDFLQLTAEIGIIGGLCYIFYIFFPFWTSFKKTIKYKKFSIDFMIFLIILVFIVDSMLNFPIDRPINLIFLFFAMAVFYKSDKYYLT